MEIKSIALLSNATRMLAKVETIDDAKNLMDIAAAAKHYAQKHGLGKEAVNFAKSIEISAEIKLGEILKVMEKNKGEKGQFTGGRQEQPPAELPPTLKEMGISKDLSSEAQALADLPTEIQEKVKSGKKTKSSAKREQKRKKIKEKQTAIAEERAALPKEEQLKLKPSLVLADPPWQYDFAETESREIENQYSTLAVKEIIQQMPITEKDCILFLWATAPKIIEALEVIFRWGYEYKTQAIWDKGIIGSGYWFRGQHELLLVATKGTISPPLPEYRVSSIFTEHRTTHSTKPECVYEWIERAFPHLVKLEMYCRNPRPGWLYSGNEVL